VFLELPGRVAIVTGAARGIGFVIAERLSRAGASVVIADVDDEGTAAAVERLSEAGGKAAAAVADVTSPEEVGAMVERALDAFGRLDILVNNAAVQRTHQSIEEISSEEWESTFRTNIHAQFYLCKAAIPHMRPGASIVNTTSVNAKTPSPSLLAYATTKGAIANFTAGLAQLVAGKGIRVNCVAPGPIWTPLIPSTMPGEAVKSFGEDTPLGRAGQPAELAPVYVMLASEEASYVTGALVPVTGGRPML
jgi:NAD(P)-dependent dehydrogenase (short-subunit alcohol dehydrogenase family)